MIIGTAGHIDHGKTTLVRALTGVDTDRLQEEKARGISIELGYAYLPADADAADGAAATGAPAAPDADGVLGFIDVPGHERFVHTMAAGAAGIDHLLLVVAADDGVMPQTREHLAIVELFGIARGTVALTKCDRVDAARIAAVRAEVAALLAASPIAGLQGAPVFETAVPPGGAAAVAAAPGAAAGIDALRRHLVAAHRAWEAGAHARRRQGLFRLAVDRVFTLAGHGTVVTGTVFAGAVRRGDTLVHAASGRRVRVRGVHAQGRAADAGRAGQRVALNLADIDRHDVARGDWIADPRVLQASLRIDTRLRLLADAPALGAWAPLHVHLGAAHRLAHAVPLQGERLAPGEEARVQLVLDAPLHVLPGDRFIVRNAQGTRTVGGGAVLDPLAPERRRRSAERMRWLDALEDLVHTGHAGALLEAAPAGLTRSALTRLLGHPPPPGWAGEGALSFPLGEAAPPALGEPEELWLSAAAWSAVRARVLATLARHHAQAPDEPGLNAARLQRMAFPAQGAAPQGAMARLPAAGWQAWIERLLAERDAAGAPLVGRTGHWLHLPAHRVRLDAGEEALAARLHPLLEAGGNDPPWVRDLARATGAREEAVRELLRKEARLGTVYQVVKDLFYPAVRIAALAQTLATLAAEAPAAPSASASGARPLPPGAVEARAFRDAVQLGRKRAIQILEFFDRVGYTRRVGDAHLVRPGVRWAEGGPAGDWGGVA